MIFFGAGASHGSDVNDTPPLTADLYNKLRDYDIDVYTEYLDLVLSASAAEAYLDIGQADMANAYTAMFQQDLQVLGARMQKKEIENET